MVAWRSGAASSHCCHHELAKRARDLHFQFIRNYQDSALSPEKRWAPVLANQGPEGQSSHISLISDEF